MAKTVLCVGKAVQDVFLIDEEFDPHCEGRVCYTHLPLGAKMDITQVVFSAGGNAPNVAVTLARQGHHAKYLWALGTEPSSVGCLQAMDEEGVDTSGVVQSEMLSASHSTVLVANGGERTILNYKGALPTAKDIERLLAVTPKTDWVYPTSVGSLDVLEKVISWAEKHEVKVMLNPAGTELEDPERLKGLLESVDVLCMNKEEMQQIVEGDTLEELVRHGLHYCPVVLVTDGREGSCVSDGKTLLHAGLYDKRPALERTGAGDAFASGFLSQWIKGKSLRDSVHFASANGSSVVMQIGAQTGILYAGAELDDMEISEKPL